MKCAFILLLFTIMILCSGCSTIPQTPVVPEPIKVQVPYPVPCKIDPVEKPQSWAMDSASPQDSLLVQVQKALSEIQQRRAYETELETAIKSCQ